MVHGMYLEGNRMIPPGLSPHRCLTQPAKEPITMQLVGSLCSICIESIVSEGMGEHSQGSLINMYRIVTCRIFHRFCQVFVGMGRGPPSSHAFTTMCD